MEPVAETPPASVDLNIHIRLDEPTENEALRAGRAVPDNLIRLGEAHVPHITLMLAAFCGATAEAAAAAVLEALSPLATFSPIRVEMRAGMPAAAGVYTFWDAECTTGLCALCEQVQLAVAPCLEAQAVPPWVASLPADEQTKRQAYLATHGTVNAREFFRPHVTIGVTATPIEDRGGALPGGSFVASSVHVAAAAEYGTVLPHELGVIRLTGALREEQVERAISRASTFTRMAG